MSEITEEQITRALAYPFDPHPEPFLFAHGEVRPLDHAAPDLFKGRTPILAVGSNASPKRLTEKFGAEAVIPVSFAVVEDHVVAHSAKFTSYGSMPATLHVWSGARARVHATWLTDDQLAAMDATESLGVEYERVEMDAILLDAPGADHAPQTYLSIVGAIGLNGVPMVSASAACAGEVPPRFTQHDAQSRAMAVLGVEGALEAFIAENLADASVRAERTAQLSTRAGLPYAPRSA
ncbi:MAG: hypothetical protein PVI23_13955 [Maricaulaceae bacterium]